MTPVPSSAEMETEDVTTTLVTHTHSDGFIMQRESNLKMFKRARTLSFLTSPYMNYCS